ncbi:MAG: 3-isopropylmalate dehydratase small subunit [Magnetovibrio sp.]|nr:3-isopropylmalate dehydratase small subunit [Magnetovibrio sp.]
MEPFKTLASVAVPIDIANCDTDQIIPARFLRRGKDDPEYPRFLFHDLRFNEDGSEKDFVYNKAPYCEGRILVADVNWGCGSSRENAVTALVANDIRSIIAPSIADIHYNNCIKNGVLPIRLTEESCAKLRKQLREHPGAEVAIDLETQSVTGPNRSMYSFDLDSFDKYRLLNGLDDVGLTLELDNKIDAFRAQYQLKHSWANGHKIE